MHYTPATLTADMILRTPMGALPDTSHMTPDDAAATLAAYVCEYHNANQTTDAMHEDADAALVSIMVSKLICTDWGREIIAGAIEESVYSHWMMDATHNGPRDARNGISFCIEDSAGITRMHHNDVAIARATAAIWNGQHGDTEIRRYIADAIADHDAGCIDADAADAIMQVATFGEIIYG